MLENVRFCAFGQTWSPHYDRYLLSDDRYKPDIVEVIQVAGKVHGLQGIELLHPQHVRMDNLEEIKKALENGGFQPAPIAASISGKRQYRAGSLTADDKKVRQEAIDTVKNAMEVAAALGTDRIFLWLGRDGYDYSFQIDYDVYWGRLVDAFKEIGEHRPDIKIAINYKIKEPRRWLLASSATKVLMLIDEVNLPNIGVMLDSGHSLLAYENPAETVALLARKGRLFHTHLNDSTRFWDDDMVFGSVQFFESLEMLYWLDRVGYRDWISFNPHTQLEEENPTRSIEEALRYSKGMISILESLGNDAIEKAIQSREVTEIMALVGKQIFGAKR